MIVLAQKPFINSISPTHVEVGQTVTITGSNLANVTEVFFGGVSVSGGDVTASNNVVTAVVPAGATHGVITVLNTTDNLIAQSSQQFFISFSGSEIVNYDNEFLISSTQTDAYDVCMCDLDSDGKNDVIISHNIQSTDNTGSEISIYHNNTASTSSLTTEFSPPIIINNAVSLSGFISLSCADLNNDAKPELIFSSNSALFTKEIYVYHNQSTVGSINMVYNNTASQALPQTSGGLNRNARRNKIADIDGDGNPDLVVGNEQDATIHIYRGNGDLTFAAPDEISVGSASRTSSIDIADFNNDGRIDIVALPFRQPNELVYVLKNNSQPGNIDFELEAGISSQAQRINVATADFDEDGLIDIVVTNQQLQRIAFHRNTSTGSDITFGAAQNISMTGAGPWGVDIADMNGDGKPDVIVASTTSIDELYVIENNSTSGSISFNTPTALTATNTSLNLCVGDLNGDARPDIAFSHNIATGNPGNLGIFLNRNCVEPVISPDNLEFCYDDQFTLETTKTSGAIYQWSFISAVNGGSTLTPIGDGSSVDVVVTAGSTTPVNIQVEVTHDDTEAYECSRTDNATFTLIGGTQPSPPTFGPDDLICVGDDYTINVSGGPFETYEWTRPNGTTTTTTTGSLSITGATINDAGIYTVRARPTSGCFSEESLEFNLEVSQPPLFGISNNDLDDFCETSSVTLVVPDFSPTLNYQWQRDNVDIAGATGATLNANLSGSYTVEVQDGDGCITETDAYSISAISEPVSSVSGPTETCVGFETTFTATSTGQSGFTLNYSWQVDGSPVSPTNPTELLTTFSATGAHTVTLTTSYDPTEVESCSDVTVFNVTVSPEPTITFNVADGVQKCQAETINIQLDSPPSASISTYTWSTRNAAAAPNDTIIASNFTTSSAVDLSTPIGVDSVYAIVSITTTIGCEVIDSVKVRNFPTDVDISSPDADASTDEITLDEENFIRLTAEGVTNVSWSSDVQPEPTSIFDDPGAIDVTVFPNQPTTVITLTGTDDNNCTVSSQITLLLDNLRPKRTFSPNGDGTNDCWEILNSSQPNTAGCKVYVFDSRGRNIKVADAPFENNCVWDGNSNGSPVPEGVYYFVFKCDNNSQMNKTGSILLAR